MLVSETWSADANTKTLTRTYGAAAGVAGSVSGQEILTFLCYRSSSGTGFDWYQSNQALSGTANTGYLSANGSINYATPRNSCSYTTGDLFSEWIYSAVDPLAGHKLDKYRKTETSYEGHTVPTHIKRTSQTMTTELANAGNLTWTAEISETENSASEHEYPDCWAYDVGWNQDLKLNAHIEGSRLRHAGYADQRLCKDDEYSFIFDSSCGLEPYNIHADEGFYPDGVRKESSFSSPQVERSIDYDPAGKPTALNCSYTPDGGAQLTLGVEYAASGEFTKVAVDGQSKTLPLSGVDMTEALTVLALAASGEAQAKADAGFAQTIPGGWIDLSGFPSLWSEPPPSLTPAPAM